jgi:alkylated DNA repair dioxygenase AlkB
MDHAGGGAAQQSAAASSAFHDRSQAWMRYRGHELNRDKYLFVRSRKVNARGEPLSLYKYVYPGFQWESPLHYQPTSAMPALDQLLTSFSTRCSYGGRRLYFNHVIATRYEREHDSIRWHSDKMADIMPGTPILSLNLDDLREFHLFGGAVTADAGEFARAQAAGSSIMTLRAGDVFIIGQRPTVR